jgi:hypothetical protein
VDASFHADFSSGGTYAESGFPVQLDDDVDQLRDRFGRRPLFSGHLLSQTLGNKKKIPVWPEEKRGYPETRKDMGGPDS